METKLKQLINEYIQDSEAISLDGILLDDYINSKLKDKCITYNEFRELSEKYGVEYNILYQKYFYARKKHMDAIEKAFADEITIISGVKKFRIVYIEINIKTGNFRQIGISFGYDNVFSEIVEVMNAIEEIAGKARRISPDENNSFILDF